MRFLDRDGVLNKDNPLYTYRVEAFEILPGVIEATRLLKTAGFRLIVVTNQSGIAQGIYTQQQMEACHRYFQQMSNNSIDHFTLPIPSFGYGIAYAQARYAYV